MLKCGHVKNRDGLCFTKKKRSLSGFVGSPRFQIDPAGQAVFSEPVASPGFAKFRPGPRL
jgi:hypothetical protein